MQSFDLGTLISIGSAALMVAVQWGIMNTRITTIIAAVDHLDQVKASKERINTVLARIDGLEQRILDRIDTLDDKLKEVK
tara:strand:+ start:2486 stop:2725 length:240 start_codon:yes stop_codon:yes gene_type:complete